MRKLLLILLIIVCIFSLCSLTLGTTIDGLFTGTNNSASADDYGQFLDSFGVILNWFKGFGDFFRSTLDFVRNVGVALADAWEAVEGWFADVGASIIDTIENVMEFFGWVNEEKPTDTPPVTENSALRSRSKEVLDASLTEWSLALITTPQGFSTRGKDLIYVA